MKKNDRDSAKILKLNIVSIPKTSLLRTIRSELERYDKNEKNEAKFSITTPNPEQAIIALKDKGFRDIINSSEFALADGIGLAMAYKFYLLPKTKNIIMKPFLYFVQGLGVGFSAIFDKGFILKGGLHVIKGREFFDDLIKICNKRQWKVFLIGNNEKSAQKAKKEIQKNYFGVKVFAESGPLLNNDGLPINNEEKRAEEKLLEKVNKEKPHLLFVGFGAPKQEKWLSRHFNDLKIGGAMVVGGTFDYISGEKKPPPELVGDLGLEWLWRFYIGDQKLKRIVAAFPLFAWKVFLEKCRS